MRHQDTMPRSPRPAGPQAAWEKTYPGLPAQARAVRADLRPLLAGCRAADETLLLISELAANAIKHSDSGRPGGTFTVRLARWPGRGVQAEVRDQGGAWPGDLPASARSPHGLYLLRPLSTACGAHRDGKACVVWFRLACCGPDGACPASTRYADGAPGTAGRRCR